MNIVWTFGDIVAAGIFVVIIVLGLLVWVAERFRRLKHWLSDKMTTKP